MKELLVTATEYAVVLIDFLALILIVVATVEVSINVARLVLAPPNGHRRRDVWLRYARWLVAALTLQLASDIIESSITTEWEAVGRLAAVAVIRTFLNYFLERDLAETTVREIETGRHDDPASDGVVDVRQGSAG